MRILVSQFRCPKCKTPIKSALVENCPKCGVRLTTNFISKRIGPVAVMTVFGIIIAGFILSFKNRDDLDTIGIIFSMVLTTIIVGTILVFAYFKNKKKLHRDEEYIGSFQMVELEHFPVFADIKMEKGLIAIPIISISALFFIVFLLMIDISYYNFIDFDDWLLVIMPSAVLIIVFLFSSFYALSKFNKKMKEFFQED